MNKCTYKPDCPWYDGTKCNSPNDHTYNKCDYDRGIFPDSSMDQEGQVMRILFNVMAAIEIPDADKFPPKDEVEKALVEIFEDEGAIVHGLEITNYRMLADEQEGKE